MASTQIVGGGGLLATAIVVLLLSLTGAGMGFAVGILLQPDGHSSLPETKTSETKHEEGEPGDVHGQSNDAAFASEDASSEETIDIDVRIIPIPAVLTTLAAPQGRWVRLEGSILARADGETQSELLAERAGEQILTFLRTVKLEQIQGPSGLLALRDDLNETVSALSSGEVQAVLIHGLLVE